MFQSFCQTCLTLLKLLYISDLRSKNGRFVPGIHDTNFDAAVRWTEQLGYRGPLVLGADDTCLDAALDTIKSGCVWYLVGMHGNIETFASYEELISKSSSVSRQDLASKVSSVIDIFVYNVVFLI